MQKNDFRNELASGAGGGSVFPRPISPKIYSPRPIVGRRGNTCATKANKDVHNVWGAKRLNASEYEHPTSKPPSLHEKAIKRCTKPDDIILDSFAGSGSTLIAAESLHRRVYSIEQNPIFCEVVRRRYEKLTGNKVEIIKNFYEKG